MSNPASSLPERWIQSLWGEMRANYGGRWDRMFPVPPCPPDRDATQHVLEHNAQIQGVWAKRLGRFMSNPQALRHALDNLPEDPPNLPQFEALCNRRPDRPQLALSTPKADPERIAQALAGINRTRGTGDALDWARSLHDRDLNHGGILANGKHITLAQRATYRQALGLDRWGNLTRGEMQT